MDNELFLSAFETCTLPSEQFKHRAHLRLAWLYLNRYPFEAALARTCESILRYASSLGAAAKFHVTITHAWVHLVQQARVASMADDFDAFMTQSNWLQKDGLLAEYYSPGILESDAARTAFIPPDLKPFN